MVATDLAGNVSEAGVRVAVDKRYTIDTALTASNIQAGTSLSVVCSVRLSSQPVADVPVQVEIYPPIADVTETATGVNVTPTTAGYYQARCLTRWWYPR